MPPTGGDKSMFKLRGLNGEKVAFPIEGFGWRLGGMHLEGVALPDGVVITIFGASRSSSPSSACAPRTARAT